MPKASGYPRDQQEQEGIGCVPLLSGSSPGVKQQRRPAICILGGGPTAAPTLAPCPALGSWSAQRQANGWHGHRSTVRTATDYWLAKPSSGPPPARAGVTSVGGAGCVMASCTGHRSHRIAASSTDQR